MQISVFGVFLLTGEVRPLTPRLLASIRRHLAPVVAQHAPSSLRVTVGEQLAATRRVEVCCRIETEGEGVVLAESSARLARDAVRQALDALACQRRAGRAGRPRPNPARAGPAGRCKFGR